MHNDALRTNTDADYGAEDSTPFHSGAMTLEEIKDAAAIANVPTLLMVLHQFTGDDLWLQDPYQPTRGKGLLDHDSGGLPQEVQLQIRHAAVDAIWQLQSGVAPKFLAPSAEQLLRMMSVYMGEPIDVVYGQMLSSEFARRIGTPVIGEDNTYVKPPENFNVIVIGTGVAGVAAAEQLEAMGISYVILEKQQAAGGNWWQNTYPGCGVDTPSHLYSFSFAQVDWKRHFALRDDVQSYIANALRGVGAERRVRYDTEVMAATYDEARKNWQVQVKNHLGVTETMTASVVISAVGVLNRPTLPKIPGMEKFKGTMFHSAEWKEGVDLKGKRVAVVGTGASSMQIVSAIGDRVGHLTVFQRSAQWVAPFDKFGLAILDPLRMLMQTCPLYRTWYWLRMFWQFGDKVIEVLRKDPLWPHPERSVNARNDAHRDYFTRYLREELDGRDDLFDKCLPTYPPFGKRILLDNGWFRTLRRDNVSLVTEAVSEVREHTLVSSSGEEFEVDIVIWATGFDVARFVSSLDVRGIDGLSLREAWNDDDPRAYLGISVPQFPNLLLLGGPNSFPGSGSFMFFMEVQMRYIRRLLEQMFQQGIAAVDAREAVNDKYNELVDDLHDKTVWTHPGMSTYYKNSKGRVVFVMPFLNVEYWEMVKNVNLEDYTLR